MPDRPEDTTDELHELAAMYLTGQTPPADGPIDDDTGPVGRIAPEDRDAGDSRRAPRGRATATPAELVLVAHLPGPVNLWLHQYAQRRAEEYREPLTLVRIAGQTGECDRFTPMQAALAATDPDRPSPPVAHLIYPGEADEPIMRRLAGRLNEWTVLTGADPAAIVAAYRLIKQWMDARPGASYAPMVRLMFLGCDGQTARSAARKIERATGEFLDVPLGMAGVQQQMQPVRRRRTEPIELTDRALEQLLRGERSSADDRAAAASPDEARISDEELAALSMADPPTTDDPTRDSEPDEPDIPTDLGLAAHDVARPPRDAQPVLSDSVPELTGLAARHPHHAAVELACDNAGRLHLLAHAGEGDGRAELSQLVEVRAWAFEHAALLALACPQLHTAPTPARMHLFVSDVQAHQGLLRCTGSDHAPALHLLLPVTVGTKTTWSHVPLTC